MATPAVRMNDVSAEQLKEREATLDRLEKMTKSQVQWYECGAPAYRKMRLEGTGGFPQPHFNANATTVTCTARDKHKINLRIIRPASGASKGVFLHFHAGGFVMGSSMSYDNYLTKMADTLSVTAASVEYRLAPEHPYPMAQQDAVDAALFALSAEGESQLGAPLKILGGESAGGYLAVWTALSLRKDHNIDVRSKLDAVIATAGIFDMTLTPSVLSHERNIIIGKYGTEKFVDAAFGNVPMEGRKLGTVSPLYADTSDMPPALFLVGQVDPLVDDSVFMASRWSLAGNKTQLRVVPAACHAWTLFPLGEVTDEGLEEVFSFVKQLKQ